MGSICNGFRKRHDVTECHHNNDHLANYVFYPGCNVYELRICVAVAFKESGAYPNCHGHSDRHADNIAVRLKQPNVNAEWNPKSGNHPESDKLKQSACNAE